MLGDRFAETFTATQLRARGADVAQDGVRRSAKEWLRFPTVALSHVAPDLDSPTDSALLDEFVEDARYAPYLERQEAEVAHLRSNDAIRLSDSLDYAAIPGLSNEMIERLSAARPDTLGAAARLRGITPAALSAILLYSRKRAA